MRFSLWTSFLCFTLGLLAGDPQDALAQAELALQNRLDHLAEVEFSAVIAETKDPLVRFNASLGLARVYMAQGKLSAAGELLDALPEAPHADSLSRLILMRADIELLKNNPVGAEAYLDRLPILSGDLDFQRKRLQARSLDLQGRQNDAVNLLKGEAAPEALAPQLQLDLADVWYPEVNPEGALEIWTRLAEGAFADGVTQQALLQLARHALVTEEPDQARLPLEKLTSGKGLQAELEVEVYPVYIRLLEKEGRYLEAAEFLKAYDIIVEQQAASISLQALRAHDLIRGGDLETASQELKKAIALWGDQADVAGVQLFLARMYMEQEKLESAKEAYQAYLSVFTDPAGLQEAETGLAAAYEGLMEYAKAERLYDKIFMEAAADSALKPMMLLKAGDMAFALKNFPLALERYERFLELYPEHERVPQVMIQTATVIAGSGSVTRALNVLSRILLKYPDSPFAEKAMVQQAILLQQSMRPEQALGAYDRYLELYPEGQYVADAMTDKGITAYRLGVFDLALRQFTDVSRKFPEHPRVEQAQSLIGWTYYLMGKDEEAREAGRAFLKNYPKSRYANEVRFWLAEMAYNRGEYPLASESFQALTAPELPLPLRAKAHYLAGRSQLANKQLEGALLSFVTARELDGKAAFAVDALFYTGDVLTELGRFDEAILIFDQLIRNYPDSYLVYAARGRMGDCQYTLGEKDASRYLEALNSYKLVEESKDAGLALRLQAMYKVGRTLNALDRREEARRQHEKMIQMYMENRRSIGNDAATWFLRAVMSVAQSYEQEEEYRGAIRIYEKLRDSGLPQAEEGARRIEDLRREQRIIF